MRVSLKEEAELLPEETCDMPVGDESQRRVWSMDSHSLSLLEVCLGRDEEEEQEE
jgi:hypothetical protein